MSSPQVQGDHAIATVYYAPELPSGVLEKILAPLKGNVQALCTACSLNKDFGKAAAEPSVWCSLTCFERKRSSSGHLRGMLRVTDKRLAALVRRSRGELAELDVQRCDLITARGVAASLEGCSKVRCLRIKGVLGVPGDVNVLPVLRNSLLRASDYWNRGFLDVRNYVLCNCNSKGRRIVCAAGSCGMRGMQRQHLQRVRGALQKQNLALPAHVLRLLWHQLRTSAVKVPSVHRRTALLP